MYIQTYELIFKTNWSMSLDLQLLRPQDLEHFIISIAKEKKNFFLIYTRMRL